MKYRKWFVSSIALLFLIVLFAAGCDAKTSIIEPRATETSAVKYTDFYLANGDDKNVNFDVLRKTFTVYKITNGLDGSTKEIAQDEFGKLSTAISGILLKNAKTADRVGYQWRIEFTQGQNEMSGVTVSLFISATGLIVSMNDTKGNGNVDQMFELASEEEGNLDNQIKSVWEQS
jgi:hypothetical protein